MICICFFNLQSTKTTKERLEEIQNEIEQIEHSKWVMMRSQKHMIGFFLFITTLLYLASTAAFYVYYFEKVNKTGKAQFFACLLAVPLL